MTTIADSLSSNELSGLKWPAKMPKHRPDRERTTCVYAVLEAATRPNRGAISIMNSVGISYTALKLYLDTCTEKGLLIEGLEGIGKYTVTEKGYRYMELYRNLCELLDKTPFDRILFDKLQGK